MNKNILVIMLFFAKLLYSNDWLCSISPNSQKLLIVREHDGLLHDSLIVKSVRNDSILFAKKFNVSRNGLSWITDNLVIITDDNKINYLLNLNKGEIRQIDKLNGIFLAAGVMFNQDIIKFEPINSKKSFLYKYNPISDSCLREVFPFSYELWHKFTRYKCNLFFSNRDSELGLLDLKKKTFIPIFDNIGSKIHLGESDVNYIPIYNLLIFSLNNNDIVVYSLKNRTIRKVESLSKFTFPKVAPNNIDLYVLERQSNNPQYYKLRLEDYLEEMQ